MDDSANQPPEPPKAETTPDKAAKDISADRRRFFSQLLALGLDGVEHVGRNMGKRFGDAIAAAKVNEPEPQAPAVGPDPAPHAVSRDEGAGDGDEQDQLDLGDPAEREPDGDADDEFFDRAEVDPTYD